MKKDLHPNYNKDVSATCACGAQHSVGTTMAELKIEICSACHPFYTGKEKIMDAAGRVEKFKRRLEQAGTK